jgi:hypothetical protein
MRRERALKVVLVVVGLIFCALAYPLIMFVKQALRWRCSSVCKSSTLVTR